MAQLTKLMFRHVDNLHDLMPSLHEAINQRLITRNQATALKDGIVPYLPCFVSIDMRTAKGVLRVSLGGDEVITFSLSPRAKRL